MKAVVLLGILTTGQEAASAERGQTEESSNSAALIERIESLEAEAFGNEHEARRFENEGIVPFWDSLLNASLDDRLGALSALSFESLTLEQAHESKKYDFGILTRKISPGGKTLDHAQFKEITEAYQTADYTLLHSERHHSTFDRNKKEEAISEVSWIGERTLSRTVVVDCGDNMIRSPFVRT